MTSTLLNISINSSVKAVLTAFVGAIIGIVCVYFAPIHFDVQMRAENSGSLQYFYNTGAGFNEAQSKRIQLSGDAEFTHYHISIRPYSLQAIRIDPIETKGQFELLGFNVDYLIWHRQWYGGSELSNLFSTHAVDVKSNNGSILLGQATSDDPYLITDKINQFNNWQIIAVLISAMLGSVVALLLFMVIRYFGGISAVLTSAHTSLIIVLVMAVLFRIIYWMHSGLPSAPSELWRMWPDEGTYFSMAQYIISNGVVNYFLTEQSVMTAPINPLYHALVYSLLGSVDAIRSVNLVLSIVTIVFVYKLGLILFNKKVGLLAAVVCAVHGQFIQYSVTLLTEPLFLFSFIAGIYYLVLTVQNLAVRHLRFALISAVFLTLTILTRSIALLLPVFLLVLVASIEIWRSYKLGKPSFQLLRSMALPLLLPIMFVGVILIKNYILFDKPVVATGSGAALWLGSRADTEGDEPPYRKLNYDTQSITGSNTHISIQGDSLLMAAAKENIIENPWNNTWWAVKKIGRLTVGNNFAWFYPRANIIDWYHMDAASNTILVAKMIFQIILAVCIAVYGVIGLIMIREQVHAWSRLILAASAAYIVLLSIPFLVIQRYGLPVTLLLSIPAAAAIERAWYIPCKIRPTVILFLPLIIGIVIYIMILE